MNIQDFTEAGEKRDKCVWSNAELKQQIDVLACVIAYLNARKDAQIVAYPLRLELNTFCDIQRSREGK